MDTNKLMEAAKMIIVISLVFNLIMIFLSAGLGLLGFGAGKLTQGGSKTAVGVGLVGAVLAWLAEWGIKGVVIIGNIAIIAYGGFTAAKKGNDPVNCGLVGLVTFALVGLICGVVELVITFFGLGATVVTSGNAFMGLLTGFMGTVGIGFSLVCGIAMYVLGLPLNFIIALLAGLIGGAK